MFSDVLILLHEHQVPTQLMHSQWNEMKWNEDEKKQRFTNWRGSKTFHGGVINTNLTLNCKSELAQFVYMLKSWLKLESNMMMTYEIKLTFLGFPRSHVYHLYLVLSCYKMDIQIYIYIYRYIYFFIYFIAYHCMQALKANYIKLLCTDVFPLEEGTGPKSMPIPTMYIRRMCLQLARYSTVFCWLALW